MLETKLTAVYGNRLEFVTASSRRVKHNACSSLPVGLCVWGRGNGGWGWGRGGGVDEGGGYVIAIFVNEI